MEGERMRRPEPVALEDAFKQYSHDQDKIISPAQTVKRFREKLARSNLKILDDIVRIDNGRLGIPVFFSICGPDARAAIGNYKQMGKGATPDQAQASAVMELGERFSLYSFFRNPANFTYAPRRSLDLPAMDFKWIARSIQDESSDLPRLEAFFNQLPMQWTWAHNLTAGRAELVPFDWFWTINEFNGSSAGNCNEEALCQGICEVVERHVSALISGMQIKAPQIEMQSIDDPVAQELIQKYQRAGVKLYLNDFTLDMGIPSISALAFDPCSFPAHSEIVWTAGTTPSPAKALCRALTEVAQLAGDFNSNGNYVASGLPKLKNIEAARFITHPGGSVALRHMPDLGDPNIRMEVERCIDALSKKDMNIFTVDVRHPDLDLPVFYTIIPGTRFRERATHANVAMICAKVIAEQFAPDRAISLLDALSGLMPPAYFLEFYLGRVHISQDRHETAVDHLQKAIDLQPPQEDLAAVYAWLGVCLKEMGRYQQALEYLQKGAHIDPERTDILNLMGFCHYKLAAHEDAITCFKKLVELNPGSAIDYANIGSNYRAMGRTGEAIEYYQLALALDPGIEFARDHLDQLLGRA
jgi:ribosomal protein S12 methylthiotransferase accessory factor